MVCRVVDLLVIRLLLLPVGICDWFVLFPMDGTFVDCVFWILFDCELLFLVLLGWLICVVNSYVAVWVLVVCFGRFVVLCG